MYQSYIMYNGKRYERGTVFVVNRHNGIEFVEYRIAFVEYNTTSGRYCFLTPNSYGAAGFTSTPNTNMLNNLIRIDEPTEKEKAYIQDYLYRENLMRGAKKNRLDMSQTSLLLKFGLLILFVALPPVGLVVYLCIVFSDGTPSGFIGCLTPFLILVAIAWLIVVIG